MDNEEQPHTPESTTKSPPPWQKALALANQSHRCGATTRRYTHCQSPAMPNGRCRMHGGSSTGASTGNQNAYKTGEYSEAAITWRRNVNQLIRDSHRLCDPTPADDFAP